MGAIRHAIGQRDLRLLLGAGLISMTGDWVLRIGLTCYIYVLTGSTLASALMLLTSLGRRLAEVRAEWADGLALSTHRRVLRVILTFVLITCVGEGIMSTLFAPFVRSVLHGSVRDYGFIVSAQAIGGIAGGPIAASIGDRVRASRMFGWGAMAFGAIDVVMFTWLPGSDHRDHSGPSYTGLRPSGRRRTRAGRASA
jgi:predicted MFS family arabinose efflux permease